MKRFFGMDSKLYLALNRLSAGLLRIPIVSSEEATLGATACYHTSKQGKGSLYSKISPLGSPGMSVKPELAGWAGSGKKVRVGELLRIIHDLRKRKRFSQALEVSEWMKERGLCKFSPSEHAVQLDLIGRVHGFTSAEGYFSSLPDEDKTDKTYGALLNCYVRQRQISKSFSHLEKMKEMGLVSSPLTYNNIMCLYTNTDQLDKVPEVLAEMKENNVKPDNYSYRICINSYGKRSDLKGMERILREMETQPYLAVDWNTYAVAADFYVKAGLTDMAIDTLKKAEVRLDKTEGTGFNFLVTIYTKLGRKDEVLRLWGLEKSACKRCINRDYITVLESLVKLGELDEAKNLLKEWESSGNCYDFRIPNVLIVGFCQNAMLDEARAMLEDLRKQGKSSTPNSWAIVASGYLDNGEMGKALEFKKHALSLYVESKGWKPNRRVVLSLLNWIGKTGRISEVESFVEALKRAVPMDKEMYHTLIRAYIQSDKDVNGLMKKMRADNIDEDEETKEILSAKIKQILDDNCC